MALEEKFAYMVNFGTMDYSSCLNLQKILGNMRRTEEIPDLILYGSHHPVISFGGSRLNNGFTENFLQEIKFIYGNNNLNTIKKHLETLGIKFYDSTINGNQTRGGGTAYSGPGQLAVYPIVDYEKIAGINAKLRYKNLVDDVMVDTMNLFKINAKSVKVSDKLPVEDDERKDRKDVWVEKDGKPYKIGGKAIYFSGNIASHGFSIYVNRESVTHFDKVLICGYSHEQLGATSMEHELERKLNLSDVRRSAIESLRKKFGYEAIRAIDLDKLLPHEVVV